ncbi:MAG: type II secretion system protein [Elusimicrobiota bacterium]
MFKKSKGFTLIELMIVVAIIGILAAVAVPKFADLIRNSKEGATKGNLGSIRSAIQIYYGENEGMNPAYLYNLVDTTATSEAVLDATPDHKYLDDIPMVKIGAFSHADANSVVADATDDDDIDLASDYPAAYVYGSRGVNNRGDDGKVAVCCTHTDTKNRQISSW